MSHPDRRRLTPLDVSSREMDEDYGPHLSPDASGKPGECRCNIGWDHDMTGNILDD
jgi:hypothetical protein